MIIIQEHPQMAVQRLRRPSGGTEAERWLAHSRSFCHRSRSGERRSLQQPMAARPLGAGESVPSQ